MPPPPCRYCLSQRVFTTRELCASNSEKSVSCWLSAATGFRACFFLILSLLAKRLVWFPSPEAEGARPTVERTGGEQDGYRSKLWAMGVTGRKSLARTLPLRPGATLVPVLLGAARGRSKPVGGSCERAGGAASESGAGLNGTSALGGDKDRPGGARPQEPVAGALIACGGMPFFSERATLKPVRFRPLSRQ